MTILTTERILARHYEMKRDAGLSPDKAWDKVVLKYKPRAADLARAKKLVAANLTGR